MKSLLFIVVTVIGLGTVSTASAQGNYLSFHSDAAGSSCFLNYTDLGVATTHVIFTGSLPSSAIQFSAVTSACWSGATWLGDVIDPAFLSLGSSQDPMFGISVAFTACLQPPIYVGTINHLVTDVSAECCSYGPGPATVLMPGDDLVIIATVDCTDGGFGVIRSVAPSGLVVNGNPSCPCEQPLAATTTTWGQVKALYRQ